MVLMCLDKDSDMPIIYTVDFVGWETDALADKSGIEGLSFYSSSIDKSYLVRGITKEEARKVIESLYETGKASVKSIAEPYSEDGEPTFMDFFG